MTRPSRAQRIAEHLIRRACRHLPADARDEYYREWTAEVPAILDDHDIRPAILRPARALSYAIGVSRSTRRSRGTAALRRQDALQLAIFPRPHGIIPATAAVTLWITIVLAAGDFPPGSPWVAAAAFLPDILMVTAVVRFVLWIRHRSNRTPGP